MTKSDSTLSSPKNPLKLRPSDAKTPRKAGTGESGDVQIAVAGLRSLIPRAESTLRACSKLKFRPRTGIRHGSTGAILALTLLLTAVPSTAQQIVATGHYVGDSTGVRTIEGVGFHPDLVIVKGNNSEYAVIRTGTMAVSHSRYLGDVATLVGTGILQLVDDGFLVGNNKSVNDNGAEYYWIAMQAQPGTLAIGSYIGTGTDGHVVPLDFQAEALLVLSDDEFIPYFRQIDMEIGRSVPLVGGGIETGQISGFYSTWFVVDGNDAVNAVGRLHHYVAFSNTSGLVGSGSYVGDGVDGRVLDGLGFSPSYVMIKSAESEDGQHRPASVSGDATLAFKNDDAKVDRIQALLADGFELGKHNSVNDDTRDLYWLALGNSLVETDLGATLEASADTSHVGSTLTYTLVATNEGPADADGVVVDLQVPLGTTFASATTFQGDYDSPTGVWDLGALAAGASRTLYLAVTVDDTTSGTDLSCTARISLDGLVDPVPSDNVATAVVHVAESADLAIDFGVDDSTPAVGDTLNYTVVLKNNGPADASDVFVHVDRSVGLSYVDSWATNGSYINGDETWDRGDFAGGMSDTLVVQVSVDPDQYGLVKTPAVWIEGAVPNDPVAANDTSSVRIEIAAEERPEVVLEVSGAQQITTAQNGDDLPVLLFSLSNHGSIPDTLRSLTVTNASTGDGTQEQLDSMWRDLTLQRTLAIAEPEGGAKATLTTSAFDSGRATFGDLGWVLAPGSTVEGAVLGAPSTEAPDGYLLEIAIGDAADIELAQSTAQALEWPVDSGIVLTIDGFSTDAIELIPFESQPLAVGSIYNLVLAVHVPANGFLEDTLTRLNVVNYGLAEAGTDITTLEAWADTNGNLAFEPLHDEPLGAFVFTGDRWELTGLAASVPPGGLRVFVSADIAESATSSATAIRLGIPGPPDYGIGMASANDGPTDEELVSAEALSISGEDRVILKQEWIHPAVVYPAASGLPLLHLTATNTYSDQRILQSLAVTNTTQGAEGASIAQLDSTCRRVQLRLDKDGLGLGDDEQADPVIGSGAFESGRILFDGLGLKLPAGDVTHLYVTADLGLMTVADGDRISAQLASITDIQVESSTIVAEWPVDSGARWTVDGSIAAQIRVHPISIFTLGPDDGPALAMDFTVPADGYLADELRGIRLLNDSGDSAAGVDDLTRMTLWADGGDGVFEAAGPGSDDELLGPMNLVGGAWTSPTLSRTIPAGGLRLFTSLTVSSTPRDSATVRLVLPVGGVTTASGNSGPLDAATPESGTLVLSTSPLLSSLAYVSGEVNVGQSGEVRMTVVNRGGEQVNGVAPALAQLSGDAPLALGSPTPASADLPSGASIVFSWTVSASAPGLAVLEGGAAGTGNDTGLLRRSVRTPSPALHVSTPVPGLDLYPVTNLPFSINRGQTGVVPLTLTLANPGDEHVADAHLDAIGMVLRETPTGAVIPPAELLSRLVVHEGTEVYANVTDLATAADSFEIALDRPAVVTGDEPVTLAIRFDLRADSTVPSFVLSIDDASWFGAVDAVGGQPVTLSLAEGAFPVQSGQGNLVTQASSMAVAVTDRAESYAGPGQADVVLAELELSNVSSDGTSSSIELGAVSLAFRDGSGARLADPAAIFSGLSLATSFQSHFTGPVTARDDSTLVVQLSPPVLVPGATTLVLRVSGDVTAEPVFGTVALEVADTWNFDARDANTGAAIGVSLSTAAASAPVRILGAAETLMVAGQARLPEAVSQGAAGVDALRILLRHPGFDGTAAVAVDTLRVDFFDNQRDPLDPSAYLDALRVLDGAVQLAGIGRPGAADGSLTIPITNVTLEPGTVDTLDIQFDIRPDAPAHSLEMSLAGSGLAARDAVRGDAVQVVADAGETLPLYSGTTRVILAADELVIAARNRLPAILAPQPDAFDVLMLTLSNPADAASGAVEVHELTFRQADGVSAPLGRAAELARLTVDGQTWSEVELAADATSVTLAGDSGLEIPASGEQEVVLEIQLRSDPPGGALALQLSAEDVVARPADALAGAVYVSAASGQSFPLKSSSGTISTADLEGSYANFPNPFEAGREATTFVYSLPSDATVTLRLLTPHGESVITLLDRVPVPAGLRQTDQWDGRNGNGKVVRNGVYIAELTAEFADGGSQRVLRKVAVVR